ncbi:sushi, von Willebrand factor type A, EGF and pentraxin domain-containing protein 1-like [Dendronephthya gigantea]|uniref:sushi, von Willebrand factor type A, EGF and pentraxin domain-containing protein 1-like n=1 Tax=Dendronephthya gigantea TaxID=151771 RepID=UPI00106A03BB|nr:sushi, von Willebrand factor type A, EGF and pentraxin domain-containing protein 1-like [Dendronephthya gigantea]
MRFSGLCESYCCMIVLLASCFIFVDAKTDNCVKEGVFKAVSKDKPLIKDEISSHYVNSWLECGSKCLRNLNCTIFSYSTDPHDKINCNISKAATGEYEFPTQDEKKTWKTFEIRNIGLDKCLRLQLCLNDGRCGRSCEPDGYVCTCRDNYHGKHCENKIHDEFDLVFSSQEPLRSYVEVDNMITTDLTQFTFSTWFKISRGEKKYDFFSHKTDNNVADNIGFHIGTPNGGILHGQVMLLQTKFSTSLPPINDNTWHHLSVVWDNINGRLDIFIDGTPQSLTTKKKKNKFVPGGGKFVIGQQYKASGFSDKFKGYIGQINDLNLWNTAFSGERIETIANLGERLEGNMLAWSEVFDNIVGNIQVVKPTTRHITSKCFLNTLCSSRSKC